MRISVRLSRELSCRLDRLAALTGTPKLFLIRDILEDGIVAVEDTYLVPETSSGTVRIRRRRKKTLLAAKAGNQ